MNFAIIDDAAIHIGKYLVKAMNNVGCYTLYSCLKRLTFDATYGIGQEPQWNSERLSFTGHPRFERESAS